MAWCNTYDAKTQHLAEIVRHVAEDAHAILIMDRRAGICPTLSSSRKTSRPFHGEALTSVT